MNSLYERWPVIGHGRQIEYLENVIKKGLLSHSYLFIGQKNVGKSTVAFLFMKNLITLQLFSSGNDEAQVAFVLQQIEREIYPDIHRVEIQKDEKTLKTKKNISIEQIREIQKFVSQRSFYNGLKIVFLTDAEKLSLPAANALLKVLEEPPEKTVFILTASKTHTMPSTIISRCQIIRLHSVSSKHIHEHLVSMGVNYALSDHISRISYGSPGNAIMLSKNPELYKEYTEAGNIFLNFFQKNIHERFQILENLIPQNGDHSIQVSKTQMILSVWQAIGRDLLVSRAAPHLVRHHFFRDSYTALALYMTHKQIISMLEGIEMTRNYISSNMNPRRALENFVLSF